MGLAAPRKKAKISHDPNNTNWSRSTSGYGHRILSSHGWAPGDFLGARNAAHAYMYTAASATHIRTAVKDDTFGLGARRDAFNEPTGLDAFKGLLGRLNGKPDAELEEEERNREDIRLARYAATKWSVRFISGGLLTQEKMESLRPESSREGAGNRPELHDAAAVKKSKESDGNSESGTGDAQETSKPTKKRKNKKAHTEQLDEEASKSEKKKEKKSKERKRRKEGNFGAGPVEHNASQSESGNCSSKEKHLPAPTILKERRPMGRHILRGRYIDAKKKAILDDKSLSEIFMVTS